MADLEDFQFIRTQKLPHAIDSSLNSINGRLELERDKKELKKLLRVVDKERRY